MRIFTRQFGLRGLASCSVALVGLLTLFPLLALAQTQLNVDQAGRLYPIAIPVQCSSSSDANSVAKEIPEVLAKDLDLSGYFKVMEPSSFIETPGKCGGPDQFAFTDWSVLGTDLLVKGDIDVDGDSLSAKLYLYDVIGKQMVLGKSYNGSVSQARKIAHRFANEIMRYLTGIPGVFGTQLVFSGKVGRFKELFVVDMDGSNLKQITNDYGLNLSSSWSPDGQKIIYTGYKNRVPDLFVYNIGSKRSTQLTKGVAMELGSKYAKDGSTIVFSRTYGRDADIVLGTESGQELKRLARDNGAIDVSPDFSPDQSQIVFVSNRAGGPQIYVMGSDGSNVRRVSYVGSNYCTSPTWSPRGDKLAFVCRADAGHQLFVSNVDGTQPLQLTTVGSNEDPTWSPDGRYIIFASTLGRGVFNLALIREDGSNFRQITNMRVGATDPAWGPLVD